MLRQYLKTIASSNHWNIEEVNCQMRQELHEEAVVGAPLAAGGLLHGSAEYGVTLAYDVSRPTRQPC